MPEGAETTAREESLLEAVARSLALVWVWPRQRTQPLRGARLPLGRDESVAIHLEGTGVSRQHAELYRQGPLYVIRDLGSTNGTWLGGQRIVHAPVAPGSVLRIGEWVGVFVEQPEGAPACAELAPGLFGGHELALTLEPVWRAARSTLPIALIGETGTGKERVARALHHYSARSGPFLAINCAALPEQLAEAELFGYRRGAFTGAERPSSGYFRAAHQGTLFLDEVAELSPALQAKLLRVLEEGKVTGLGEVTPSAIDVRIVSAGQRPLRELVAQGLMRQDLAARLRGMEVLLPTLQARRVDIAPLFSRFLSQHGGGNAPAVEARLIEALCLHDWPENVRELETLARRLLALHGHEPKLKRHHLPPELQALNEDSGSAPAPTADRREFELSQLQQLLARNGGNVKAAAEALGISRQRVYRLLDGPGTQQAKQGSSGSGARD